MIEPECRGDERSREETRVPQRPGSAYMSKAMERPSDERAVSEVPAEGSGSNHYR